jgi:hypothetical protein
MENFALPQKVKSVSHILAFRMLVLMYSSLLALHSKMQDSMMRLIWTLISGWWMQSSLPQGSRTLPSKQTCDKNYLFSLMSQRATNFEVPVRRVYRGSTSISTCFAPMINCNAGLRKCVIWPVWTPSRRKTLSSGGSGMLVDNTWNTTQRQGGRKLKNYKLVSYTEAVNFKVNGSYPL